MKRLFIVLLAAVASLCCALLLTACPSGESGDSHTHLYTETVTEPTCTEQGYTLHTCSCGDSYKDNYTAALGHSFTNYVSDENATCTADGTKTAVCDRDGCSVKDTVTDESSALGHDYVNGVCTRCGVFDSPTEGILYTLNSDEKSYSVAGIGTAVETDIVIASEIDGLPVTSIGAWAFDGEGSELITSIAIPDSVTSIGSGAFSCCSALTSITIPDSVISIGGSAFGGCSSLTSITFPDSVTSIGGGICGNCSALTNIAVGENNLYYKSIDGNLYSKDGTDLIQYSVGKTDTSFTIPNSVTSIGDSAFCECSSLTSITIPNGVTSIGESVFEGCTKLTSITIPGSVTSILFRAFSGCELLTSVYYCGTADEWKKINIDSNSNSYPTGATVYYFSDSQPTDSGNYWHYENGEISVWGDDE